VFYFGVSANWVINFSLNSAFTAAVFGLAAFASPPFRPKFLLATTVLSDLFAKTLAFFALIHRQWEPVIKIAEIRWSAKVLKYYRQAR